MKNFKRLFIILICLLPALFYSCDNDDFEMPYKMYSSTLNQSNSENPIESVILNEMNISLTWTRVSQGVFRGSFSKPIDIKKTTVQLNLQEINKVCTSGVKDPLTIEFMVSEIPNTAQYTDNFSNLVVEIKDFAK